MGFLTSPWLLIAILGSYLVFLKYKSLDQLKPCPNPLEADPIANPECFISESYLAAKTLFKAQAEKAGAQLFQLKVSEGLNIDVAVLGGTDPSSLVLHVAGTHGVEGYAGSAIQTAFLAYYTAHKPQTKKTVILIHGLNAYGMANWRRVNENNVDLNRNSLFQESKRKETLNRDPNAAGYENWTSIINPQGPPSLMSDVTLFFTAVQTLLFQPFAKFKRALVTGTYTNSKGLFYGGRELQTSHAVVRAFLRMRNYTDVVTNLVLIDVHTGLGPFANDTLMMNENVEETRRLFASPSEKTSRIPWEAPFAFEQQTRKIGSGNIASEGYDLMVGDVQSQYPTLFPKLAKFISTTQEFGTSPAPLVVRHFPN